VENAYNLDTVVTICGAVLVVIGLLGEIARKIVTEYKKTRKEVERNANHKD
jgi:hypothetical protein